MPATRRATRSQAAGSSPSKAAQLKARARATRQQSEADNESSDDDESSSHGATELFTGGNKRASTGRKRGAPSSKAKASPSKRARQSTGRGKKKAVEESEADAEVSEESQSESSAESESAAKGKSKNKGSLFDIIKGGRAALGVTVRDWISRYKKNAEEAVSELTNLVLHSSGCEGSIPTKDLNAYPFVPENLNEAEDTDKSKERVEMLEPILDELLDADMTTYPLEAKSKSLRKFPAAFQDFWIQLISAAPVKDVLCDDFFIPSIVSDLVTFSNLKLRSIRHTATIASLHVISGLIAVTKSEQKKLQIAERQRKAARGKQARDSTSISKSCEQHQENIQALVDHMTIIFDNIFVIRYRDVRASIQAECQKALGEWMRELPGTFLFDKYLKYMGWALSNKPAIVRTEVVRGLLPLYEQPSLYSHLEGFTARFKDRIIAVTSDVDATTATAAIKLCTAMIKTEVFDEADKLELLKLTCLRTGDTDHDTEGIRAAAGEFAAELLFGHHETPSYADENKVLHARDLKEVVTWAAKLNKAAATNAAPPLTEAVFAHAPVLKQFEVMKSIILGDNVQVKFTRENVTTMCAIFSTSFAKALQRGSYLRDFEPDVVPKQSKAELASVEASRQEAIKFMIRALPLLIKTHETDEDRLIPLIDAVRIIPMDSWTKQRQHTGLTRLVTYLRQAYFKHGDHDVLMSIVQALDHLQTGTHSQQADVEAAVVEFAADISRQFSAAMDHMQSGVADVDELDYSLLVNLRRVRIALEAIDMSDTEATANVVQLLEQSKENGEELEDGCIEESLHIALLLCLDERAKLMDDDTPDEAGIDTLVKLRDQVKTLILHFLTKGSAHVAFEAFSVAADFVNVFSRNLIGTPVASLALADEDTLVHKMISFFDTRVSDPATSSSKRQTLVVSLAKSILHGHVATDYLARIIGIYGRYRDEDSVDEVVEGLLPFFIQSWGGMYTAVQFKGIKVAFHKATRGRGKDKYKPLKYLGKLFTKQARKQKTAGVNPTVKLMKECIEFVYTDARSRMPIIGEIVIQLASILSSHGHSARSVLTFLEDQAIGAPIDDGDDWAPHRKLIKILKDSAKSGANVSMASSRRSTSTTRKKLDLVEDNQPEEEAESDEESADSASSADAPPARKRRSLGRGRSKDVSEEDPVEEPRASRATRASRRNAAR